MFLENSWQALQFCAIIEFSTKLLCPSTANASLCYNWHSHGDCRNFPRRNISRWIFPSEEFFQADFSQWGIFPGGFFPVRNFPRRIFPSEEFSQWGIFPGGFFPVRNFSRRNFPWRIFPREEFSQADFSQWGIFPGGFFPVKKFSSNMKAFRLM